MSRHARYTYAELDATVNAAAQVLRDSGIAPGDRVAWSMGNHADLVVGFLACMRLGAIWVGLNRALTVAEKTYLLDDSGASLLVADPELCTGLERRHRVMTCAPDDPGSEWPRAVRAAHGAARPDVSIDAFAPAAIAYTSGTTGRPKGAVHSQHNMMVVAWSALRLREGDERHRNGVSLPLTLLNLMILGPLASFSAGDTCIAVDRVDPLGLDEWIRAERIDLMALVPTMLRDLLTHPDVDLNAFRDYFRPGVGGADLPPAWRELFEKEGIPISQGYGLTEAPTSVTRGTGDDPMGSAGRALGHVRLLVVDSDTDRELLAGEVGEICVAPRVEGPHAHLYTPMLGYWHRPDATREALRNGRLHTGDIGVIDADGFVYIRDRRNDLILRGGANVYPAEVERVLSLDPRVAACAVVGVPDERLGERVMAAVQLAPDASASEAELREHCARQLARYKVPDRILVVDELPRTPMGKVVRRDVRPLFS